MTRTTHKNPLHSTFSALLSSHFLKSLALGGLLLIAGAAQAKGPNVLDVSTTITDDAIVYPESFEADTQKMLESWYIKNYTATDDRYKSLPDPDTSDEEIRRRLALLPSGIDLPFNSIVRSYIDRYTKQSRPQIAALLGLSIYYMPIFEQALEAEGLPLELKYLPVIESALDPNAVSKHGAAGLWQFMPAAAKGLGMELNSLVDERRDPYISSQKAAQLLRDLYDAYGDWSLAIAAYNCGPGAVNKAIRRAGGDPKSHDFWSIYKYLTPETRGYVPMFIAANYVMNYYPKHNISPVLASKPLVTDTVAVTKRLHFDQISNVLNIPKEELRILNPQFRADLIPANAEKQYMLILPSRQVQAFLMSEKEIYDYHAADYAQRTDAEPYSQGNAPVSDNGEDSNDVLTASHPESVREETVVAAATTDLNAPTRTVTHTVAQGETINDIAALYNVRVTDIRSWNSLRRNAVRAGQKLTVKTTVPERELAANTTASSGSRRAPQASGESASSARQQASGNQSKNSKNSTAAQTPAKKKKKAEPAPPKSHEIKSGESLSSIAKKYGVTVDELKKANNMKDDNIRAGKSLNLPSKKGSSAAKSGKGSKKSSGTKTTSSKKKKGSRKR